MLERVGEQLRADQDDEQGEEQNDESHGAMTSQGIYEIYGFLTQSRGDAEIFLGSLKKIFSAPLRRIII
jgi:hypothetical protein